LTHEEVEVLKQGLVMSGRIEQAIGLLEEMTTLAEIEGKESTALALRDEIVKLRAQSQNPGETPSLPSSEIDPSGGSRLVHKESKIHLEERTTGGALFEDEEVMSFTSTPTVSTVQMSHLSDVLSVQINDVEVSFQPPWSSDSLTILS
jgi:hypothetical protein